MTRFWREFWHDLHYILWNPGTCTSHPMPDLLCDAPKDFAAERQRVKGGDAMAMSPGPWEERYDDASLGWQIHDAEDNEVGIIHKAADAAAILALPRLIAGVQKLFTVPHGAVIEEGLSEEIRGALKEAGLEPP